MDKNETKNKFVQNLTEGLLEKYAGNDTMIEYAAQNRYEIDLYSKFNQYYGYVFYIGRTKWHNKLT